MESNNTNPLVLKWLVYKTEHQSLTSINSYEDYDKSMKIFCDWLLKTYATTDLLKVTEDILFDYRKYIISIGNMNRTINIKCAIIRSFYKWALEMRLITENPSIRLKKEVVDDTPNFVPTAEDIFRVRSCGRMTDLEDAAAFETAISTGLRLNNIAQLRCCDIYWNGTVIDLELEKPSPYVMGTITISIGRGFTVKQRARKIVYINRMAGRLILALMKKNGLTTSTDAPLFSISEHNIRRRMQKRCTPVMNYQRTEEHSMSREKGFLDLNVESEEMKNASPEYIKKVKQLQDTERKRLNNNFNPVQGMFRIDKMRPQRLTPHSLRHFFGCMMYYRNYHGNRRDIVALKNLMGHKDPEQSQRYADNPTAVQNDRQWKQIMLGRPLDYSNLRLA